MAIEAVPGYGDRISLFTKKLRLAQYSDSTIHNQLKFEFGNRSALPLIRATRVLRKVNIIS